MKQLNRLDKATQNPQKYTIQGSPKGWRRAGRNGEHTYDTQKEEKTSMWYEVRAQHGNLDPYEGPLHVDWTFYMAIPQSLSVIKQQELAGQWYAKTPDIDNLCKLYSDGLTGLLWPDDRFIVSSSCRKVYDTNPRVEIAVTRLCNKDKVIRL